MENKTTSELLDLIGKYEVDERNDKEIPDKRVDEFVTAMDELKNRAPFKGIFNVEVDYGETKESLEERIGNLGENYDDFEKKMKRHKHDERSGDVMIRI